MRGSLNRHPFVVESCYAFPKSSLLISCTSSLKWLTIEHKYTHICTKSAEKNKKNEKRKFFASLNLKITSSSKYKKNEARRMMEMSGTNYLISQLGPWKVSQPEKIGDRKKMGKRKRERWKERMCTLAVACQPS